MNWLAMLLLVGASQGGLLSVVILCMKTGDRLANCFLASLVAFVATRLLLNFLAYADIALPAPLYGFHIVALLLGPSLYLYVRALTEPDFQLRPGLALHALALLPGLIFLGVRLSQLNGYTGFSGIDAIKDQGVIWVQLASTVLTSVYGVLSLQKLTEHRAFIEQTFSVIEEISLSWLRWLILLFIGVKLLHLLLVVLADQGLLAFETRTWLFLLSSLGMIYLISIGGLRQPLIFTQSLRSVIKQIEDTASPVAAEPTLGVPGDSAVAPVESPEAEQNIPKKYKKSGLDPDRIALLWSRLTRVMDEEQPYIESALNLPALAKIAAIKPHDLSRVINTQARVSFYEFVNGYRVDAAKALLITDNKVKRTMLDIAMDVGFNSQSTFYSHFKKHTGMTPKQFRDRQPNPAV
ncbi:MAG: helix-turn-helix domain-containing protein [Pseudomonadales bacterium]